MTRVVLARTAPGRFLTFELAQKGNELAVRLVGRAATDHPATPVMVRVGSPDAVEEVLVRLAGAEHGEVRVVGQTARDLLHEPSSIRLTARFKDILRSAPAVAHGRVVADVAGRSMLVRYLRGDPVDPGLAVLPADDDGFV